MVQFDSATKTRDWTGLALDVLATAVVTILLLQASDGTTLGPNMVIGILLLAHLLLLKAVLANRRLALVRPDMRLVLLILLLATILGQFAYGLYGAALYSGLLLVLDRYLTSDSPGNPA